jgi:pentose-5-phosphate-3-epimerase
VTHAPVFASAEMRMRFMVEIDGGMEKANAVDASNAFASFGSLVSNPFVNHPQSRANISRACSTLP